MENLQAASIQNISFVNNPKLMLGRPIMHITHIVASDAFLHNVNLTFVKYLVAFSKRVIGNILPTFFPVISTTVIATLTGYTFLNTNGIIIATKILQVWVIGAPPKLSLISKILLQWILTESFG